MKTVDKVFVILCSILGYVCALLFGAVLCFGIVTGAPFVIYVLFGVAFFCALILPKLARWTVQS